jgi:hypothetical protein
MPPQLHRFQRCPQASGVWGRQLVGGSTAPIAGPIWYAGFDQLGELLSRYRPAEIIALPLVTLFRLKKGQLFRRFDALRNDPQLEAPAHANHGGHNARIAAAIAIYAPDERLVDLESIDRELQKVAQAGVTRAEVGPPPMKWSDSKYGFATEEDCNGEEATQAGRDRCEVAAG